ncbi:MAG TPA: hypothetical protein VNO24_19190 [Blastocatellia bacterium]|nr:hypothetical protein [Blastocatellia bacterium]
MKIKLKFAISALVWALMLMAAYVASAWKSCCLFETNLQYGRDGA